MSREQQVKDILVNDPTIMALLTGGVYTEQEVGIEGIRRGDNSPSGAAYDSSGRLLGCALIREGGVIPFNSIRSISDRFAAITQTVSIYFYEMRGMDIVKPASERSYELLEGAQLPPSYPIWMEAETPPIPDDGPMMNSTVLRQDWIIVSIRQ